MAYTPQSFIKGQVLKADHLNHMEEGISAIDKELTELKSTVPGTEAVSPTISTEEIDGGTRVTVTDVNGQRSFDVMDGTDGKSAYEQAKDAGYTGSEEEFNTEIIEAIAHVGTKDNPHGVTAAQVGSPTMAEMNEAIANIPTPDVSGQIATHDTATNAHSDIRTLISKKANDFSIELYNGTAGNPKPVKFATVNYSSCTSEAGVSIKIGMVSGHGNGTSYAFLQDAIIKVNYNGGVEVDNFKYYGAETAYDGAKQFGDIFWIVDATNKIVDFYCLMGQYARLNMTPFKRLTYSSGGTIVQYTSCAVYSSGTIVWANNSDIALMSDVNAKAPAYSYSQEDLTAGTSALETGKLHFVYE